jgi:hypothetical protein
LKKGEAPFTRGRAGNHVRVRVWARVLARRRWWTERVVQKIGVCVWGGGLMEEGVGNKARDRKKVGSGKEEKEVAW